MIVNIDERRNSLRPISILDKLTSRARVPATAEMPPDIAAMIDPQKAVFIKAKNEPALDISVEKMVGTEDIWRVVNRNAEEGLLTGIPGKNAEALTDMVEAPTGKARQVSTTTGYRPPWLAEELMPRLLPFRNGQNIAFEPRAQEEDRRLQYPYCTVGTIFPDGGGHASGVLVGPNLVLTAGHVAPWGQSPWGMQFVPAFRAGDQHYPYGSSYVESYRGFNTGSDASGKDYIICKLYTPLGNATGWLGTAAFGSEDDYYRRSYVASGYPHHFNLRPAVEFDLGIRDIDNDSPGLELETVLRSDFQDGWSGGPLWLPHEGPWVVGVLSGAETDGLDPRRAVFAGGHGMVDLVNFGLTHWRP